MKEISYRLLFLIASEQKIQRYNRTQRNKTADIQPVQERESQYHQQIDGSLQRSSHSNNRISIIKFYQQIGDNPIAQETENITRYISRNPFQQHLPERIRTIKCRDWLKKRKNNQQNSGQ